MTTHPVPVSDIATRTDSRALHTDEVRAQWLQNVGAGVGTATICALLGWGFGADFAFYWRWPLIVGGCIFGAGMVLRAYVDEYRAERDWRKREAEHATEMTVLCAAMNRLEQKYSLEQIARAEAEAASNVLRARLNDAELEAARLSREQRRAAGGPNTILREDFSTPAIQRNTRTLVDFWTTKRLVAGQMVYVYPSRESIMSAGLMTKGEWENAMNDFRRAGCVGKSIPREPPPAAELMAKLAIFWANPRPSRPDGWTGLEVADDDGRRDSGE